MSKMTAILAGCVAASLVSLGAQAFSPPPMPTRATAPEITPVADYCGPGFHRGPYGGCEPNTARAVEAPGRHLAGPPFGIPYAESPYIPYVGGAIGLPYVSPPVVVLPWPGLPEVVWPPACPYGYTYVIHSGRCVVI